MSDLDELGRRLDGLRRDVEPVHLRDADAVRRRGQQRGRRQAAAATVGAFAVVGAVTFGAVQGLQPRATDLAPAGPSGTATAPADGSAAPTTPPAEPKPLTEDVLLPVSSLPVFGPYEWTAAPVVDTVAPEGEAAQYNVCQTTLASLPEPRQVVLGRYYTDLDPTMWQAVLDYGDAGDARSAYAALVRGCETTEPLAGAPAGTDATLSTTFSADTEYFGALRGVVVDGSTVTVLAFDGMVREQDVDVDAFSSAAADAAERVGAELAAR